MADKVTGPIAPGAPVRARDILSIKHTADQAAGILGGHGFNITRSPAGLSGSVGWAPQNLKTYSMLYALNDGAAIIQPREHAVITGNVYDALDHPFQQGRNQAVNVRHATAAADDTLHWGVAVDAIPIGQMGRFCIGGVSIALVIGVAGTDETNFQVKNEYDSSDRYLRLSASGQGQVLWRDSVNYAIDVAHPALVRFPSGGGAGGMYKVANYAALPDPATVGDGALGYTEDTDYLYVVRAGAWRITHPFTTGVLGVVAGDLRYYGNAMWFYNAGAWNHLSTFGTP